MPASERGLMVSVYRDANGYDCTNGGASSKAKGFTVIGVVRERSRQFGAKPENLIEAMPDGSQVFAPHEDRPAAVLVEGNLSRSQPYLVPLDVYLSGRWSMFGGNIADFSDGRWGELVSSFNPEAKTVRLNLSSAVYIHDRVEG